MRKIYLSAIADGVLLCPVHGVMLKLRQTQHHYPYKQNPPTELAIIMKAKDCQSMISELLSIGVGVYPKEIIGGNNPYKKRTKFMDGWNAAIIEYASKKIEIVERYKKLGFEDDKNIKEGE